MTNLNPGGSGYVHRRRVYGFENIRRAIQARKPDYARDAENSIATGNRHGGPHLHKREIARRLRNRG